MTGLDELKRQKLEAELEDLRFRLESERRAAETASQRSGREELKSWLAPLAASIGVVSTVATLYFQSDAFLDQKARDLQQRQKEYRFQVTQELVTLVKQLSGGNESEMKDAALLLSAFEEDAVPILLNHLGNESVGQTTIEALRIIQQIGPPESLRVREALVQAAQDAFTRQKLAPTWDIVLIVNHVDAVAELLREAPEDAQTLLTLLEDAIEHGETKLDLADRYILVERISQARSALSSQPARAVRETESS